jgi:hypothetical protein
MDYRYVVGCDVAESILRLSGRQREELITIFRSLAANPFLSGESSFPDSSLRVIQKKRFGRWLVSYWPDDPVMEIRIVGVQRIVR